MIVGLISLAALVLGGIALYLTLTRATPAPATGDTCRSIAWSSLPTPDALPQGWTITGSGFYTDGYGAALAGPLASGQSAPPQVNVRVSCYGSDSHQAVTRSRNGDLALGGTVIAFADIGDEAVATRDSTGSTTSVYVRRGPLVASLAATQEVSQTDLEETASAIDDAMTSAEAGTAAGSSEPGATDNPSGALPTDEPIPTDGPTPTPAHEFPSLEAVLPQTLNLPADPAQGSSATARVVALTVQSTTGTGSISQTQSFEELIPGIEKLGKTGDDLHIATAFDPSDTPAFDIIVAFQVKGITADVLRQTVMEVWLGASSSGITTSTATIAGRQVTTVDYHDDGPLDYLFASGDVVFDLSAADPAIAAKLIAATK